MSGEHPYDLVIVGAGVSGLCLARALLAARGPWSIALVDGARDDDAFRALSMWSEGPTALDALVRHRWRRLVVADEGGGARVVALGTHTYQTLFFAELQREVLAALRADPRHRVIDGRAGPLRTDGERVRVAVGAEELSARWGFDSRFHREELAAPDPMGALLWQRFHGVEVRCGRDAFDPTAAVFLDFRAELPAGTAFAYVLPFSAREALVELVSVAPVDAETALRRYLARVHGVEAPEVVARESGLSPLTARRFDAFDGPRVRRIGIAGGRMKASTGYALTRILDDSAAIVQGLQRRGDPMVAPPERRGYRLLDAVFLTLWARWPARMPAVFAAMFGRVSPDRVLRFLDERASAWDLVALVARLPLWPFLRALAAWVAGRALRRKS
ncbi:MAG: hypothetical protein JWM10_3830 [Myxococcaceae bacterium]|nr:hypothetical protein [Myxococcaceae bacterium]